MFFTLRKNFRPLSNNSLFSEYILKTNNKFYDSIKKDCENYTFKKNMRKLIDNDNDNDNLSITNHCNDTQYDFFIITITTFSIGLYSFLYFYRFKK